MKSRMIALFVACAAAATLFAKQPKYVFLIIGDGLSTPQRMAAEEFSRATDAGPLAMNGMPHHCTTRTRSADALVTDSAAAATAIACGEKANNGALGVAPDGRRLESVAEFARRKGMKVGIMTTVTIVHATPAGFYAHRKSRGENYNIALDLLASGFDFFAGGGVDGKHDDRKNPNWRGNVFDLAKDAGYTIVKDRKGLEACTAETGKIWGVFSQGALDYAIDANAAEPTLAEMVAKAAEVLKNPNGFFIMAEGGSVDWAGHSNDAATSVRETIAMDHAVKAALEFAKRHPDETLVVTTGDHETGGLAMGYAGLEYRLHVDLLAKQKISGAKFASLVRKNLEKNPDFSFADAAALATEHFGLIFDGSKAKTKEEKLLRLTKAELEELKAAFAADKAFVAARGEDAKAYDSKSKFKFAPACRRMLANHSGLAWSTGAHTALPALTTAQGCGAERFSGFIENTDISKIIKELIK